MLHHPEADNRVTVPAALEQQRERVTIAAGGERPLLARLTRVVLTLRLRVVRRGARPEAGYAQASPDDHTLNDIGVLPMEAIDWGPPPPRRRSEIQADR